MNSDLCTVGNASLDASHLLNFQKPKTTKSRLMQ